ncbi:hypothetical protein D3C71_2094740 [compost metagenome]
MLQAQLMGQRGRVCGYLVKAGYDAQGGKGGEALWGFLWRVHPLALRIRRARLFLTDNFVHPLPSQAIAIYW